MFGDDWALLGNAGTNPATNFLGTTDAQDLVIRTNNTEKMRIESGGDVGIGVANPVYKLDVQDAAGPNIGLTDGTAFLIFSTDRMRFNRNDNYRIGSGAGYSGLTSFGDIMILEGLTHDVGIGTTTPPYRLTIEDELNSSNNESASVTITTASYAYADNDFNLESIYGVYGFADQSTSGRTNYDYGYGVVGSAELGFRSSIGVYGTPSNIHLSFTNTHAAMVGVYDADRMAVISQANLIYWGEYTSSYNGYTFASYLRMKNHYNSTTIGKYGLYIENTSAYGLKYGIRVVNDSVAQSKYGVLVTLDGYSVNDNINGVVYYGNNANSQGWGMLLASESVGVSYIAGGGGLFAKSRDFVNIGYATNSTGTGVIGVGNNYGLIPTLVNGSGVAGSGTETGVYGIASNAASSEGGSFAGNGQSVSVLAQGSGVAATGTYYGIFGHATSSANGSWGGYFSNGGAAYAYVGGRTGGTNYKIRGAGTVATIVKDENNNLVTLFCPEAPEILFQDYGTGKLINGYAHIDLDPSLSKNIYVDEEHPIKVFVQLEGDCKGVYVTNKTATGFDVVELQSGNSNVPFSWTITANRADDVDEAGNVISTHVGVRFPEGPGKMKTETLETINTEIIDDDMEKFNNDDERLNREVEEVEISKIK